MQAKDLSVDVLRKGRLYQTLEKGMQEQKTVRKRNRNDTPCYKCQDRVSGCHERCEHYQEWRKERDAENERIRQAHEPELNNFKLSVKTQRDITKARKR